MEAMLSVQLGDALGQLKELVGELGNVNQVLRDTFGNKSINAFSKNTKKTKDDLKDWESQMTKFGNSLKKAVDIGILYKAGKSLLNTSMGLAKYNIDMIETSNLFAVAMEKTVDQYGRLDESASQYYNKAIIFQKTMNEKLGTNMAEMEKYQAMYMSMFKSQGIDKDTSYFLSEQLTKAGYDIASLYNIEVQDAMDKLKSGIAGQVEPLRKIGVDISESALQKVLDDAGIEKSVQQLSYAEKEVARYIAILNQAGQAQGDFARTFEQPANQIKVFQNQLQELQQVAGSFIVNTFGGIIKYANAVIMTIKEILKSFASLFGYDLYGGGEGTTAADALGVSDINEGLGSAVGKAKELKKTLFGFDEINNIAPDTSSGGGGGTGGGGSSLGVVDDKLLSSLKEWQNKMHEISGEAQKIRDKMLAWLGFKRNDKGGWELASGYENFHKILDVVKLIGTAIATWKVSSAVTALLKNLGLMNKTNAFKMAFGITLAITGITAQFQGTSHILNGDVDIFSILETVLGTAGGAFGIVEILRATKLGKTLKLGQQVKIGLGAMLEIQGLQVTYDAFKKLKEQGDLTAESMIKLGVGIGESVAAGALMGSAFGPWGALIGGAAGAIASLTSGMIGFTAEEREFANSVKEAQKSHDEFKRSITETALAQLDETKRIETLKEELQSLIDENGRVKEGYEDRVQFILSELTKATGIESQLIEGTIEDYDNLINKIEEVIRNKKLEIAMTAYEEEYQNALKNRAQAYEDLSRMENDYATKKAESYAEIAKLEERARDARQLGLEDDERRAKTSIEAIKKDLEDRENSISRQKDILNDYTKAIINYETLETAVITGNTEEQSKIIKEFTTTVEINGEKIQMSSQKAVDFYYDQAKRMENITKESGGNISSEMQSVLDANLKNLSESLIAQVNETKKITPESIAAWKYLAESNYKEYEAALNKIDPKIKSTIETMIGTVNSKTPNVKSSFSNMANQSVNELDKSGNARTIADRIVTIYGNVMRSNAGWVRNQADVVSNEALNGLDGGNEPYWIGENMTYGIGEGITDAYAVSSTVSDARSVANRVLAVFRNAFDIHSPSRVMKQMGVYLLQGLDIGMEDEQNDVLDTVKTFSSNLINEMKIPLEELQNGVSIDTSKMSVDANQFVDYGYINGQINSRVNFSESLLNGMADKMYNSFKKAMREEGINVNIEAKADEGVIVKKASEGFRQYVQQTGELPFPVPV